MPQTGKHKSVDASRFAMVPRVDVPRSAFDVAHTHKTTFNATTLVPVYVDEVLPGDSIRLRMTAFCRLATPLVPIMDNLIMESFFFFVPNRLLWSNWERFMGEQTSPTDTTVFLLPQIVLQSSQIQSATLPHSVADWFGITVNNVPAVQVTVNALPFRAYCLIWNDWFRDEDLEVPFTVVTGDGPDTVASYGTGGGDTIVGGAHRGRRHDYFTSARPWPQKPMNTQDLLTLDGALRPGSRMTQDMALQPYGAGAPVTGLGMISTTTPSSPAIDVYETGGRIVSTPYYYGPTDLRIKAKGAGTAYPDVRVLINDIRTANVVQIMMERNSRGGTRYAELVRTHFGVVSPDSRLQRPEYLGGGRVNITVNPVAQTSASGATGTTTVLGELAGIGTGVATGHGFNQSFTEHGVIIGLVSVRGDMTYQNGISRMWWRRTQFDFFWPALAHLGEQAIQSREIFCDASAGDTDVFGYQERWSEYKYKPSRISGVFRSSYATPLDVWHLAENFATRPVLGEVYAQDPSALTVERVLQTNTTESAQFLFDSVFDVRMVRCMPMFSIPGMGPRL